MECIHLRFDYEKATQALNYLALQNGGQIDKLQAIKLIFFADRYHLRKFGRPITNDSYAAMELGPVGSGVKDIIDQTVYLSNKAKDYTVLFLKKDGNFIRSKKEVDRKVFSKSDLEALNFAWKKFGKYDGLRLGNITHKYPEWKKHESAINAGVLSVPMNYIDFFKDPDRKYDPCHELTEKEKQYGCELLIEQSQVENTWD